jgi:RNase P/RNase MRP subunit p29
VGLTALVVLPLSGKVLAAELNARPNRNRGARLVGEVIAKPPTSLTMDSGQGEVVVGLTEDTRYLNPDREEITDTDIQIGRWVAVALEIGDDERVVARTVVLFPEDFNPEDHLPFRVVGEITTLDADNGVISVLTPLNETIDLTVTERTRYRDRENQTRVTFDDLVIGRYILAETHRNLDDQYVTGLVLLLAEDFDPAAIENLGFGGEVIAVNENANTFTLDTRAGVDLVMSVGAITEFEGQVSSLADMEVGMHARGLAELQDNGSLLAVTVVVGEPEEGQHNRGRVTTVDVGGGTFSIHTHLNQDLTFIVDEDTVFKSRDGSIVGLADLETEMGVIVFSTVQDDGSLLAKRVEAGWQRSRAAGHITAIYGATLVIETRAGESLTLRVTEDTHFGGWDGRVTALEDLEVGMLVLVSYQDQGGQGAIAIAIMAPRFQEK